MVQSHFKYPIYWDAHIDSLHQVPPLPLVPLLHIDCDPRTLTIRNVWRFLKDGVADRPLQLQSSRWRIETAHRAIVVDIFIDPRHDALALSTACRYLPNGCVGSDALESAGMMAQSRGRCCDSTMTTIHNNFRRIGFALHLVRFQCASQG